VNGRQTAKRSARIVCLLVTLTLCLLSGPLGRLAIGANQSVSNQSDDVSTEGSLPYAVANVGTGEDVVFQPAVAGKTISLNTLHLYRSMDFNNASEGLVTVNVDVNDFGGLRVEHSATLSFDSGLTFHAIRQYPAYGIYVGSSLKLTINGLNSDILATGAGDKYGIGARGGYLTINDGITGTVSASSTDGDAHGIYSNSYDITINGGISSTISAIGAGDSYAIYGAGVHLTLNETGTLSASSTDGDAYAIYSTSALNSVELVSGCTVEGDIVLPGGTLTLSAGGGSTIYAGAISDVDSLSATGGVWTLNGAISGDTALAVSGGTLTLSGTNTFSSDKTLSGGTLRVESSFSSSAWTSRRATLEVGGGTTTWISGDSSFSRPEGAGQQNDETEQAADFRTGDAEGIPFGIPLDQVHRTANRRRAEPDVHRICARNVEIEDLLHDPHLLLEGNAARSASKGEPSPVSGDADFSNGTFTFTGGTLNVGGTLSGVTTVEEGQTINLTAAAGQWSRDNLIVDGTLGVQLGGTLDLSGGLSSTGHVTVPARPRQHRGDRRRRRLDASKENGTLRLT